MTYAFDEQKKYVQQVEAFASQYRTALGHPDPFAERVKGAVFALLGPRLALDAQMPDLDDAVAGTDRGNFRQRRRVIGDRIRTAMRGRLGRDADLDDLDELLAALEDDQQDGMDRPEPEDAQDFLDEELESMRGALGEDNYRRLRSAKDRKRTARDDPPDFRGMPRTGGTMVPMESSVDRPGFGAPRDVAAKDRGFRHARQFGQDSARNSFADRFGFTRNAATGRPSMPGVKVGSF